GALTSRAGGCNHIGASIDPRGHVTAVSDCAGSAAPAVALPLRGRLGSLFLPLLPPLALAGSGGGGGLLATQFSLPLVGRVGEGVLRRLHSLPTLDLRSRSCVG